MGFLCCGRKKQNTGYSKVDEADQDNEEDEEERNKKARAFKGCPNVEKK
jgi:hypothetical protein